MAQQLLEDDVAVTAPEADALDGESSALLHPVALVLLLMGVLMGAWALIWAPVAGL